MTYAEGNNKINLLSDVLHVTLSQKTWQTDFGAICRMKTHDVIFSRGDGLKDFIPSSCKALLCVYWHGCLAVKALSK